MSSASIKSARKPYRRNGGAACRSSRDSMSATAARCPPGNYAQVLICASMPRPTSPWLRIWTCDRWRASTNWPTRCRRADVRAARWHLRFNHEQRRGRVQSVFGECENDNQRTKSSCARSSCWHSHGFGTRPLDRIVHCDEAGIFCCVDPVTTLFLQPRSTFWKARSEREGGPHRTSHYPCRGCRPRRAEVLDFYDCP